MKSEDMQDGTEASEGTGAIGVPGEGEHTNRKRQEHNSTRHGYPVRAAE